MNKIYALTIFSFFLFASEKSFSQTFSFVNHDTLKYGTAGTTIVVSAGNSIKNNTASALVLEIVRVQNVTGTPGWASAFGVSNTCYNPTVDTVSLTLQANSSIGLTINVYSSSTPDTGSVVMKVKDVNNPTITASQRYHVSTMSDAVNETSANKVDVKIYPSPVLAGSPFSLNISSATNHPTDFSLDVYDVLGNVTAKFSALRSGNNSIAMNAPQGIYFFKLVSENQQVSSGKIIVVQ